MAYYVSEFDLGVPQVQILHAIGNHGPIVSRDISRYTTMNKGLVSRSLGELSDAGYAESWLDTTDGRQRLWALTPKGKALLAKYRPVGRRRRLKLLKVLSAAEQTMLTDFLDRLYDSSEKLRADEEKELQLKKNRVGPKKNNAQKRTARNDNRKHDHTSDLPS